MVQLTVNSAVSESTACIRCNYSQDLMMGLFAGLLM